MACNSDDRRQWRKQEEAVGAAASKTKATAKRMLGAATRLSCPRRKLPGCWPLPYFLSLLSLLLAHQVPALWNTCTMSTSRMTHTIMMSVW